MQQLIITGNAGNNPQSRFTQSGQEVISFSLAVSNQDKAKTTTWYECSCWNEKTIAVIKQYVSKGTKLLLTGRPTVNAYTNKEGKVVGSLGINIQSLEFIGGKQDDEQPAKPQTSAFNAPAPDLEADSVPF